MNVTSALIDTGFWLVAAVLFQRGIIRVSLLASTVVGSWIVDVQRCADAQPHGQIGVCDKFAAERDEVAQAFAKPVRCALGVEAVNRPFNCGLLSSHFLTSLLSTRHGGSACPVGAGRGCGDGASAADIRLLAGHWIDLAC